VTVQELIDGLRKMDPGAQVRFFHLRRVREDGTGRVESYPVLEVGDADGEATLSDFLAEGPCLYKVKEVEWEQPALRAVELDEAEAAPEGPGPAGDPPVDTLLVDPPFTKEEWSSVEFEDIRPAGTPLGRRVLGYVHTYHQAVMGSNRLGELLTAAGMPEARDETFDERVLRRVLRRLLGRPDTTVRGLETLMAVGEFARFLSREQGVTLTPGTLALADKVRPLAVVTLALCVNRHFGLVR
jgi:hypothetical protein